MTLLLISLRIHVLTSRPPAAWPTPAGAGWGDDDLGLGGGAAPEGARSGRVCAVCSARGADAGGVGRNMQPQLWISAAPLPVAFPQLLAVRKALRAWAARRAARVAGRWRQVGFRFKALPLDGHCLQAGLHRDVYFERLG